MTAGGVFDVEFFGTESHAAHDPEKGVNAADALTISQVAIGLLRQYISSRDQIHGIALKGGEAPTPFPLLLPEVVASSRTPGIGSGRGTSWHSRRHLAIRYTAGPRRRSPSPLGAACLKRPGVEKARSRSLAMPRLIFNSAVPYTGGARSSPYETVEVLPWKMRDSRRRLHRQPASYFAPNVGTRSASSPWKESGQSISGRSSVEPGPAPSAAPTPTAEPNGGSSRAADAPGEERPGPGSGVELQA